MILPKDIKGISIIRNAKIISLFLAGEQTQEEIALQFKIHPSTVSRILYRNRHAINLDKNFVKAKRINLIQRRINSASPTKKDEMDLVEQLKREIEGDKSLVDNSQHVHNTIVYRNPRAIEEDRLGDRIKL